MNAKIENLEKNQLKLEITVEAEKFNEALVKAYKKNVKRFNVPGFRKGKVPMNIVKKFYGEAVLYEDAVNFACESTYPEVIKENDINPVDYPEIDIIEIGEGKDFVYSAVVTVKPEVELGEYNGVEVQKVEYAVTDEDVENSLKAEQEKNSRVEVKAEGSLEDGDIAIIDFKGYVDGEAFEGGEGTDFELTIGSKTFIDTFEEQLVGLSKGEAKEVVVTFPENYGSEALNGKEAKFDVTLKEIKVKELPELDDEFAKDVSEFETLEEFKNDLVKNMEAANEEKAKAEYEEAVIDTVCGNAKVDIPEVMINKEVDVLLQEFDMRLRYQGMDLATYYQYTNSSEDNMREFMKENAEKRVLTDLVLEAIAKAESIEATDEDVMERALEMAKQYGEEEAEKTAELIKNSQGELLKTDIINKKVIEMLVKNSKSIA